MSALKERTKEITSSCLPLVLSGGCDDTQGNSASTSASSRQQDEEQCYHPSTGASTEMASSCLPLILSGGCDDTQGNTSSTSASSTIQKDEKQCSHPSTDTSTAADISFATEVAMSLSSLYATHFLCGICLGRMKGTHISPECGHRFCGDCMKKSIRVCKKECPTCRVSIPTQRSLREDKMFENLVSGHLWCNILLCSICRYILNNYLLPCHFQFSYRHRTSEV